MSWIKLTEREGHALAGLKGGRPGKRFQGEGQDACCLLACCLPACCLLRFCPPRASHSHILRGFTHQLSTAQSPFAKIGPITVSQLAEHSTLEDCWMALAGKVYNISPYMDFHPGGADELMRAAGADGTQMFNDVRHLWSRTTRTRPSNAACVL